MRPTATDSSASTDVLDPELDPDVAAAESGVDPLVAEAEGTPVRGGAKRTRRPWWRRRPVRRSLIVTHRWTSLLLGVLLVIETTAGAIVLYQGEWFRTTHGALYEHSDPAPGRAEVTPEQAVAIVSRAHPDYPVGFVSSDHGILAVGNDTYTQVYGVDPGSGRITGHANLDGGTMGFLVNLHDCGLTCEGYPGYVAWLNDPIPTGGITFLTAITWGGLILGVLGLLMVLLAVTGAIVWWPGLKRLSSRFKVRTGKGRFARDFDLHNVIGAIAVPAILMWGVTGAAFEFPVVENTWLAVTGGQTPDENEFAFVPPTPARGAADIGLDGAIAAARTHASGSLAYAEILPGEASSYFVAFRSDGYAPYGYRALYGGDKYVYVDGHDASNVKVIDGTHQPIANSFYDSWFEAAHFGWMVNGWWRIVWFLFGLTPLALMVTGVSTWLFRTRARRRRRKARRPVPAAS